MGHTTSALILGRREWISLPDLGLPAVKAKVDTGAKTSALNAHEIETFGSASSPRVRFLVRPVPERPEISVACEAVIVDRRVITSSIGDSETRLIIRSTLEIGSRAWPIELGLTNRESMTHRMLLGRQALLPGILVDPSASFLQPRLSLKLYRRRESELDADQPK